MVPGSSPLIDDERQLATRASRGDEGAFELLVDRYLERTLRVALRMVGNREDAEDVVQDTFARAHTHLSRFHGRSSFGTWITSICINLCLDHERARKRRPSLLSIESATEEDASMRWDDGPSRRVQRRETEIRLERAIESLPRRLRAALVLRVLQGLDYDVVAESLGTTVRSARIYVSEARRRLAQTLDKDLRGEQQ